MPQNMHPIQIRKISVAELFLEVRDPNESQKDDFILPFIFRTGHSVFDPENRLITVGVQGQIGEDADNEDGSVKLAPFIIKANVIGHFTVDVSEFPVSQLDKWATENAPLILLPFLREHIYGLASRAGIKDVFIPLYVVPTYTVVKPELG